MNRQSRLRKITEQGLVVRDHSIRTTTNAPAGIDSDESQSICTANNCWWTDWSDRDCKQ